MKKVIRPLVIILTMFLASCGVDTNEFSLSIPGVNPGGGGGGGVSEGSGGGNGGGGGGVARSTTETSTTELPSFSTSHISISASVLSQDSSENAPSGNSSESAPGGGTSDSGQTPPSGPEVADNFSVKFYLGSEEVASRSVKGGEKVSAPTVTGATISSWYYLNGQSHVTWNFNSDTVTKDLVLYGNGSYNGYTVTLNAGSGTCPQSSVSVTYKSNYVLPSASYTTSAGTYEFKGWYYGTEKVASSGVWDKARNVTLVAKYATKVTPTVTYSRLDDDTVYQNNLGVFDERYSNAMGYDNLNARAVLLASAEADLLASAVSPILNSQGGNYLMSRIAPHSVPFAQYGIDEYRYEKVVEIVPDEAHDHNFIKAEDGEYLLGKWASARAANDVSLYNPKQELLNRGYTVADTFTNYVVDEVETLDIHDTWRVADTELLVQLVEGLYKIDSLGNLVPAMASGMPSVSDDGLTYTIQIKNGLKWYQADGTEYGNITADDFVAGFEHALDCDDNTGFSYMAENIVGVNDYLYGDGCGNQAWFNSNVGIRAINSNTLRITLYEKDPYFTNLLTQHYFYPMNRTFYASRGGYFGINDFRSRREYGSYTYGNKYATDSILYNSAFLLGSHYDTMNWNAIANPNYYDYSKMTIHEIDMTYVDDSYASEAAFYGDVINNHLYAGIGLSNTLGTIAMAKADGSFDKYAYISRNNEVTYYGGINLNRGTFEYGSVVSTKTEKEKVDYQQAIQNVNFRRALLYAFDRVAFLNTTEGDEALASASLRNMFNPPECLVLTAPIYDTDTQHTFLAGTTYGDLVEYFLKANYDIDVDLSDGHDAWYNPTKARACLNEFLNSSDATGISSPIKVEIVYYSGSAAQTSQAQSFKKSIEEVLNTSTDTYVEVILVAADSVVDIYNISSYSDDGEDIGYDLYYGGGWGYDKGDPAEYIGEFMRNGYFCRLLGINYSWSD